MRRVLVASGAAGATLLIIASPGHAVRAPETGADLGVSVSGSVKRAKAGELVSFTVTVWNSGPATATGVVATLRLPRGLAVIEAAAKGCSDRARVVRCALPPLADGTARFVHILGIVKPGAAGTLRAVAGVGSAVPDPVPGNDASTVAIPVTPSTDLMVRLKVPKTVPRGGRVAVTATVSNRGPRAAGQVTLHLGAHGARLRTVPGDRCKVVRQSASDQFLRCRLGPLEAGAKRKVRAVVVQDRTSARVKVQNFAASATPDVGDSRPDNNVATARVKIVRR